MSNLNCSASLPSVLDDIFDGKCKLDGGYILGFGRIGRGHGEGDGVCVLEEVDHVEPPECVGRVRALLSG